MSGTIKDYIKDIAMSLGASPKGAEYLVAESLAAQAVNSAVSGLTFPGEVYRGEADPYDMSRVMDLAGLATMSPAVVPSSGELRAGASALRAGDDAIRDAAEFISLLARKSGDEEFSHYGLRATESPIEDIPANSRIWVDGEPTEDYLNGVSVIEFDPTDIKSVQNALKAMGGYGGWNGYYGKNLSVLGSHVGEYGEDQGEKVLQGSSVLGRLSRDSDMGPVLIPAKPTGVLDPEEFSRLWLSGLGA